MVLLASHSGLQVGRGAAQRALRAVGAPPCHLHALEGAVLRAQLPAGLRAHHRRLLLCGTAQADWAAAGLLL
jgi:hypothetical protein